VTVLALLFLTLTDLSDSGAGSIGEKSGAIRPSSIALLANSVKRAMPTPIAAVVTIAFKLFFNLRFPQNQTFKRRALANLRRQFLQLQPPQIQLCQFFRVTFGTLLGYNISYN
jgi:hypothetical protein